MAVNIYADNAFYTNEYLCGKEAVIPAASFGFYSREASAVIDRHTFGKIDPDNVPDEVRFCCCELAEQGFTRAAETEHSGSGNVASESVGGWSVTYISPAEAASGQSMSESACLKKWLSGTGLLYMGVE